MKTNELFFIVFVFYNFISFDGDMIDIAFKKNFFFFKKTFFFFTFWQDVLHMACKFTPFFLHVLSTNLCNFFVRN